MKYTLFLWMVIIMTSSCSSLQNGTSSDTVDTFYLFQNNKERKITSNVIQVDKAPFELVFYNKKYNSSNKIFYSARVVASQKKDFFDHVEVGVTELNVPYFLPGTGMAADESGTYHSLIIDDEAHHYLYYESPADTRLHLHGNQGDFLKLGFEVNSLYVNGNTIKLSDTNIQKLYVVIFVDRNLNETIDKGELKKLEIQLQ